MPEFPLAKHSKRHRRRGYAEADASEDLDGGDARAKLAILALAGLRQEWNRNRFVHERFVRWMLWILIMPRSWVARSGRSHAPT